MKIPAFIFNQKDKKEEPKKQLFKSFRHGNSVSLQTTVNDEETLRKPSKKRKRKLVDDDSSINTSKDDKKYVADIVSANSPIIDAYDEVNDLIKASIFQINEVQSELKDEFNQVRASRIKGKYKYLTDLSTVISSLASTKLQAIKEIENIITTANKMEISRVKDLKIDAGDDNQAIMGLYENIVNTPRQQLAGGFMPAVPAGDGYVGTPQFISYNDLKTYDIQPQQTPNSNFSPEENRMILESNPNIKTVVVYDRRNDDRYFKVMNMQTGEYLDNVSTPDPFLLEGISFNFRTMTARNANVNMNFPLVVIGEQTEDSDPVGVGTGKIIDNFGGNY